MSGHLFIANPYLESNPHIDDGRTLIIRLGFVLVPDLAGFQVITGFQIEGLCDRNVKKQNVLHGKPLIIICFTVATGEFISPKPITKSYILYILPESSFFFLCPYSTIGHVIKGRF